MPVCLSTHALESRILLYWHASDGGKSELPHIDHPQNRDYNQSQSHDEGNNSSTAVILGNVGTHLHGKGQTLSGNENVMSFQSMLLVLQLTFPCFRLGPTSWGLGVFFHCAFEVSSWSCSVEGFSDPSGDSVAAPGSKSLIQHIFEDSMWFHVILYMIHSDSLWFYVSSCFIPFHGVSDLAQMEILSYDVSVIITKLKPFEKSMTQPTQASNTSNTSNTSSSRASSLKSSRASWALAAAAAPVKFLRTWLRRWQWYVWWFNSMMMEQATRLPPLAMFTILSKVK